MQSLHFCNATKQDGFLLFCDLLLYLPEDHLDHNLQRRHINLLTIFELPQFPPEKNEPLEPPENIGKGRNQLRFAQVEGEGGQVELGAVQERQGAGQQGGGQ